MLLLRIICDKEVIVTEALKEWLGGLGLLTFFYAPFIIFSPVILIENIVRLIASLF